MAKVSKSEKVPKSMQATFDALVELTDAFCRECLNAEYAQLSRQVTAALCCYVKLHIAASMCSSKLCEVPAGTPAFPST